ncbi:MAG TPA: hypothetical protein VFY68_05700 [Nitrososphaeraceae archaeon]|nr:hypothetical protein [Nitrososphaeraceae archaeon]
MDATVECLIDLTITLVIQFGYLGLLIGLGFPFYSPIVYYQEQTAFEFYRKIKNISVVIKYVFLTPAIFFLVVKILSRYRELNTSFVHEHLPSQYS